MCDFVLKVWTEYTEFSQEDMDEGTVNFLPGMGAFLQSIIYGFIGIRIRPEMIEFHNPMPPPGNNHSVNCMSLPGIKHLVS